MNREGGERLARSKKNVEPAQETRVGQATVGLDPIELRAYWELRSMHLLRMSEVEMLLDRTFEHYFDEFSTQFHGQMHMEIMNRKGARAFGFCQSARKTTDAKFTRSE